MRSQPTQVRLIIANLYIRLRIARANADFMRTHRGLGSSSSERARGAQQEAEDALRSVLNTIERADRPGPRLLLKIAARSAETRQNALRAIGRKAA
tara:strand:+ start:9003 stop:9290 length:288 start_codon:yes stop_codon:yes gene_type:complete